MPYILHYMPFKLICDGSCCCHVVIVKKNIKNKGPMFTGVKYGLHPIILQTYYYFLKRLCQTDL